MARSSITLLSLSMLAMLACKPADDEEEEEGGWPASACDDEPTVATSWMSWKSAVAELGHHYRYTRSAYALWPEDMLYCQYITTIEVDGETILGRELTVDGNAGMLCDAGWVETAEQVGSHADDPWAAPALTMETIYEDCCVMIMPSQDLYYTDNSAGSHELFSYCGDTYCDDGGCSGGPLPDVRIDSITFIE
jgi:hypothetical protein